MTEREQFEAWWKTTGRGLCGCSLVPDHSSPLQVIAGRGFGAGFAAGFEAASAQPAITPETGKVPPQGASAITSETVRSGPLLSLMEAIRIGAKHSTGLNHTREFTEEGFLACVAEIEQAVRAKLGAGVPMTKRVHKANGGGAVHHPLLSTDEWFEFWNNCGNVDGESVFPEFLFLAQDIEQLVLAKIGIVGKEGA